MLLPVVYKEPIIHVKSLKLTPKFVRIYKKKIFSLLSGAHGNSNYFHWLFDAYFSGFGKQKRVTLYDTLINKLTKNQIVAVIAHEIGHYKKNHIIFNLLFSIIQSGLMLYILSLLIYMPIFSEALNIENHSFHIALITFSILYTPISEISSLIFNLFSRKFEYEADEYADKSLLGLSFFQELLF